MVLSKQNWCHLHSSKNIMQETLAWPWQRNHVVDTGIFSKQNILILRKSCRTQSYPEICILVQYKSEFIINNRNKRPVGLYSPLTAGIMTDFVIMIIILSSINKSVSQSLIIHDFIINYDKSSSMTLIIIHQSWSIIITKSSVMFLIIINQ